MPIELFISDEHERFMLGWFEFTAKAHQSYSDEGLGEVLALLHYMRLYLLEKGMLPEDVMTNSDPNPDDWAPYYLKTQKFIDETMMKISDPAYMFEGPKSVTLLSEKARNLNKSDHANLLLAGAAGMWNLIILSSLRPSFYGLGKQIWRGLKRASPWAHFKFERYDTSIFSHDFSNNKLLDTMEKDILKVPALFAEEEDKNIKTPEETYLEMKKRYDHFITELKKLRENMPMLLAAMHFVRIVLTNANKFPDDLFDNPAPSKFKLEQYLTPLNEFMKDLPRGGPVNSLSYLAAEIWELTIFALTNTLYRDEAKQIWQELNFGINGAADFFFAKFVVPSLYTEKSKPLIDNLAEDIQKIPAALR